MIHSTRGMLDTILDYLRAPLVVLSGKEVSTLTLLAAVTIIVGARLVASIFARSLDRVLQLREFDAGLRFALGKIIRYAITVIGVIVALGTCGIDTSAVMAGGAVLLVGIGFGLQKLAENFISGLLLLVERPVRKGDFIDVGGVLGTVEDIGLRATHVLTRDGLTVIVPNANLVSGMVINHTVPTRTRRLAIRFAVAYGSDLERVTRVVLAEAKPIEGVDLGHAEPEVRLESFGESALQLSLIIWIGDARDELLVASRLRFAIERACRTNGITMPFPQHEVRMLS